MARSVEELRQQMSPERRARSRRRAEGLLAELRLREVRVACERTQQELAERLQIDQPNVSRLENRSDVHVSTLADYIAALGGRVPQNFRMVSPATKLPQPLMHAIHFGITVEGEWTCAMVHERMEKFPLLAFTDYRAMGQVYDEFCSTSCVSRGYDYAVIIDSQTHCVPWVGQGVIVEPGECRYSTVLMSALVPQEGNAILSNLACAIKYLYPDDYRAIVEAVIAKKHLLTTIV